VLCAGYESANQGSCKGDSGGPLMVFDTKKSKFFQVGVVVGGVSSCESKSIPACYTRLDHPEIADFVQSAGKKNSRGKNQCIATGSLTWKLIQCASKI
jgi:secreted trypsin-like serine protease